MELHTLKPAKGATKKRKRIARGQGSGWGGTAGRGHKGAKSRSGHKQKRGFEGGQTPLQRRLPKRGFKSPNRVEYVPLNLTKLQELAEKYKMTEITPEALYQKKVIKKNDKIKVLGGGEITIALQVTSHAVSASAKQAIEEKGGSVNLPGA
ncbi:MAG TPA: 50S ribosomal protein L15 [Bacteroidetes bacterium]|nr:50S ribosomal protein L15 [Bacteroidota bacterium]